MILSLLCVFGFIFLALWRPRLLTVQSTNENPLRLRPSSRVAIALYVGLVVAFAGVLPALISVVLLFWSRRFSAYAIGLLVALIAGVIIVQQTRYGYPATLDWPLRFADLTPLTWAAVAVACINPLLRRN